MLVSTKNKVNVKINNFDISNSKCEKVVGVKYDHKLAFDDHILRYVTALVETFMLWREWLFIWIYRIGVFSWTHFFTSQLTIVLCLIWICCSYIKNKEINSLHECCLETVCQDKQSLFEQLLKNDNSVSIRGINLQFLATEM